MEKKNKKVSYRTEEQQEMIKFLVIILIVVICVVGIYFFTRAFVTKDLKKKEEEKTVTPGVIDYNVTIVGSMLNRPYDSYYVLAYDKTSVSAGRYDAIYTLYTKDEEADKMYTLDLSNKLNAPYVAEDESNPEAKTLDELQFGEVTLIQVKKGAITKYIDDLEEIRTELGTKD